MAPGKRPVAHGRIARAWATLLGCLLLGAPALVAPATGADEAPPLALDDALAYALNHNPRVAAAVARVERAGAGVALAKSAARPAVTLRAYAGVQVPSPTLALDPNTLLPFSLPITLPVFRIKIGSPRQESAVVGVVWPLWTGGRVKAAVGAATAQLDATEADLQQTTEQLLYETGAGFYEVLRARSIETAAAAALHRAEEDRRTARVSGEAGVVTPATVSAAVAAQQQAEQNLALARTAVTDAEQSLNELLGRSLKEPVLLDDRPLVLEVPEAPDQCLTLALATRPEVLALGYRREAAVAAIAQAKAERLPTLSATAQAGVQAKSSPFLTANFEAIGLQFSWPLPTTGEAQAHEKQARATVSETEETQKDLQSSIAYQVETTARRLADARERIAAAQEAVTAAEAAEAEAKVSYAAGAVTRQQLSSAETALEEARARQAQAEAGLKIAQLSRARALGLMRALFLTPPEKTGER